MLRRLLSCLASRRRNARSLFGRRRTVLGMAWHRTARPPNGLKRQPSPVVPALPGPSEYPQSFRAHARNLRPSRRFPGSDAITSQHWPRFADRCLNSASEDVDLRFLAPLGMTTGRTANIHLCTTSTAILNQFPNYSAILKLCVSWPKSLPIEFQKSRSNSAIRSGIASRSPSAYLGSPNKSPGYFNDSDSGFSK